VDADEGRGRIVTPEQSFDELLFSVRDGGEQALGDVVLLGRQQGPRRRRLDVRHPA